MQIYLDMDGVLVDLAQQLSKTLNEDLQKDPESYSGSRKKLLKKLKAVQDKEEITPTSLQSDLLSHDNKEPKNEWQKALHRYKFKVMITEGAHWWASLPTLQGFDTLIQQCHTLAGFENVYILTSPIPTKENSVEKGKLEWILSNTNIPESKIFMTTEKHEHASSNAILIDDRVKYCSKFKKLGGNAILFKNYVQAIEELKLFFNILR